MQSEYLQRLQGLKNGTFEKAPPKERKPIPRVSEKKKAMQAIEKALFAADKEFYADLWANSPHKCQQCGCGLGREPLTLFFHHLLPKSTYPQFRHTPENIMILCRDCHAQAETNIDKVPKVKARRNEVVKLLLG
jgi:5-methylcytosine-specific restriction endonuclease McrA